MLLFVGHSKRLWTVEIPVFRVGALRQFAAKKRVTPSSPVWPRRCLASEGLWSRSLACLRVCRDSPFPERLKQGQLLFREPFALAVALLDGIVHLQSLPQAEPVIFSPMSTQLLRDLSRTAAAPPVPQGSRGNSNVSHPPAWFAAWRRDGGGRAGAEVRVCVRAPGAISPQRVQTPLTEALAQKMTVFRFTDNRSAMATPDYPWAAPLCSSCASADEISLGQAMPQHRPIRMSGICWTSCRRNWGNFHDRMPCHGPGAFPKLGSRRQGNYTLAMAESSLAASRRNFSELTGQCEDLLSQLNRRAGLLAQMRSLGDRIDEAYAAFASSPRTEADRLRLSQRQAKVQASIESLRLKADAILAGWWDFHKAVGEELVEMARHAPAVLSAAKTFKKLPTPNDSEPKLQVLQVRELLNKALALSTAPEPPSAPAKPERARQAEGMMTAKEVGLLCGLSDKTVYRLAKEGRVPYVRIQSSLRFRRTDVDRWIDAKSFQPKVIRKANPHK